MVLIISILLMKNPYPDTKGNGKASIEKEKEFSLMHQEPNMKDKFPII